MVAAATSQFELARALMENGADPNNCDTEGTTCLDMSSRERRVSTTSGSKNVVLEPLHFLLPGVFRVPFCETSTRKLASGSKV